MLAAVPADEVEGKHQVSPSHAHSSCVAHPAGADARATKRQAPMSSGSASPAPGAPIILIIEDNPTVLMQLEMYLQAELFACIAVESIEEGWSALQQANISLVISDLKVDALSLIQRMRANPATANIPVIIASGASQGDQLQAALDAGATKNFTKPYAYDELVEHVRLCLAGRLA